MPVGVPGVPPPRAATRASSARPGSSQPARGLCTPVQGTLTGCVPPPQTPLDGEVSSGQHSTPRHTLPLTERRYALTSNVWPHGMTTCHLPNAHFTCFSRQVRGRHMNAHHLQCFKPVALGKNTGVPWWPSS